MPAPRVDEPRLSRAHLGSSSPSPETLARRIASLEKRLRAASGPATEPDPSALALLDQQRARLATAKTPADRKTIERFLGSWERNFLKH